VRRFNGKEKKAMNDDSYSETEGMMNQPDPILDRQLADMINRTEALHLQKMLTQTERQFFDKNPDLREHGDLIGAELARIPVDYQNDPYSVERIKEAGRRVREGLKRTKSLTQMNPDLPKGVLDDKSDTPSTNAKGDSLWVSSHQDRESRIRNPHLSFRDEPVEVEVRYGNPPNDD